MRAAVEKLDVQNWTDEEENRLLELKASGKVVCVIAKQLGRTKSSVTARLVLLKNRGLLATLRARSRSPQPRTDQIAKP